MKRSISNRTLIGVLLIVFVNQCLSISELDLYQFVTQNGDVLRRGANEYDIFKFESPVQFFSEKYDHIYINTNGILTFGAEFPHFSNLPFPLEYPAIAPFYSNIDTSANENDTGSIIFFDTQDPDYLDRATDSIQQHFSESHDFEAKNMFVVTWENVGHFERKTDKLNTFQAVIIWNDEETFCEFLYPRGGLNWIQADIGESGLPDVRAQAGFISEDGRVYQLKGSGSENVRYLTDFSNVNQPGRWIFRVGPLSHEENVEEPDVFSSIEEDELPTCENKGRLKCNLNALCENHYDGFCCSCKEGYYGNGYSCIKNDVPIRVSGMIDGSIGGVDISVPLQSYVVLLDGKSYSAISPITPEVGTLMQVLTILGEGIGWLFAKPNNGFQNGFQLTGGKLNHSSTLHFETGEVFYVIQRFEGLNAWDQLAVRVEISGDLPNIPYGAKVIVDDFNNRYSYRSKSKLNMVGERKLILPDHDQTIKFNIDQEINFNTCPHDPKEIDLSNSISEKVYRISVSYEARDQALRIRMLNKIGLKVDFDPCADAYCGENTVCVANSDGDDTYTCQCRNGFAPDGNENGVDHCVDIDECASSSSNICHPDANCVNQAGGYACFCRQGFEGNGYDCQPLSQTSTTQHYPTSSEQPPSYEPTGNDCEPDEQWDGYSCVPNRSHEYSIDATCDSEGCKCPRGYSLLEYAYSQTCVLDEGTSSLENSRGDFDTPPCNIENNCSPNANCEWSELELTWMCLCKPGFDGDGYGCYEKPVSCSEEDICDIHASCNYNETLRISVCECEHGYEGDGRTCQLAAECSVHTDCGINSVCDEGLCVCREGHERDLSDFCVPTGSCGGAYCAENAVCQWDDHQKVSYCFCPKGFVGDGVRSCKSLPPPCNVRNNCGLNAICAPNYRDPAVYECICNPGYHGDGYLCMLDVNCQNTPGLCHQDASCTSTTSGLKCICNAGFIGNGSVCTEVPKHEKGFLLISQGVAVVRVPFEGGRKGARPISMSQLAIALDKDCTEGRVYWSDIGAKCIYSSKYDGSDRKIFISDDIISPEGIAVDWISRRIYWTDSTKDTVEVASLDNPNLRAVIIKNHLVNPRGIAVDPHNNKIYWSDWNRESPKIEWANLDGTDRNVLLSEPSVKLPNSLAINPGTGEVCFADAGTNQIGCLDVYSRNIRTVVSNLSYPFGLAISNDQFYWTDWTTKKIESVDLSGARKSENSPLYGNHKMYGVTAVTECSQYYSLCLTNDGDCPTDRLCLLNPRAPSGRSCVCANPYTNCNGGAA